MYQSKMEQSNLGREANAFWREYKDRYPSFWENGSTPIGKERNYSVFVYVRAKNVSLDEGDVPSRCTKETLWEVIHNHLSSQEIHLPIGEFNSIHWKRYPKNEWKDKGTRNHPFFNKKGHSLPVAGDDDESGTNATNDTSMADTATHYYNKSEINMALNMLRNDNKQLEKRIEFLEEALKMKMNKLEVV